MSGTTATVASFNYSREEPIPRIRYVLRDQKKILQQQWAITTYESGCPINQHGEWRDVPIAEEE